jgi:acyl-[acyl-carrier-protein]-phospholipid O-acyltransferase / long-chain-fatty-acid--[acyl-carrier-protein] ligase
LNDVHDCVKLLAWAKWLWGGPMTQSLIVSRRFAPLFWCQFLSAFNDNFLKNALVFLILFGAPAARGEALITVAGGVFIFPFFVLSALGGQLADRFDKARVTRHLKLAEIAAAGLAAAGFVGQSLPMLFAALVLFGVVAALFGPIKYGILPDYLPTAALPAGNALIEGATFLAILLGMLAAGLATGHDVDPRWFAAFIIMIGVACWAASLFMTPTGEADPSLKVDGNVVRSTLALLRDLRGDRRLMWGGLVLSWFWVVGATVLALLGPIVKDVVGGNQEVVQVFLAVFAVGVAIGSALASWLASGRIILLPTTIGAVVLGLCSLDLAWVSAAAPPLASLVGPRAVFASARGWHTAIDLGGLAIAGGLFVVPAFAAVQAWAGAERRARVVAAVNVLNAAFMVIGAAIVAAAQDAGLSVAAVFFGLGVACLLVAFAIARTTPTHVVADLVSIIFRAFYRVEIQGMDNLEAAGRSCIVALNHVSFLDAALALGVLGRDAVFAIDSGMAKRWWIRPFLGVVETVPLDPSKPMAIRTLVNVVKSGKSLVIFPEGRLTVTGSLMKVYDGAGLIADKTGALVVPIRHEGLEATVFSRLARQQVRRRWLPKVKVSVLEPVQLKVDAALKGKFRRQAAGTALYEIMSDLVYRTTSTDRTVIDAIIEAAKLQGPRRIAVEDPLSGPLSYRKLLAGANVLGARRAGRSDRRDVAERDWDSGHCSRRNVGGPGSGDDQFHGGQQQHPCRLPGRRHWRDRDLTGFCGQSTTGRFSCTARTDRQACLSRGHPRRDHGQVARPVWGIQAAGTAAAFRRRRDSVHVGIRGRPQGRCALSPQHAGQRRPGQGAHRFRPDRHRVQRAANVPFLRADDRPGAAAGVRGENLSLSEPAALSHHPRTGLRDQCDNPVWHRHVPRRIRQGGAPLRFPLAALCACWRRAREGHDPAELFGQVRSAYSRRLWGD